MKILQLCKKFPWPLKDGESVAVNSLSKGLVSQGVEMDLLAMNTSKHFTVVDSEVLSAIGHYSTVKWVPLNNSINIFQALWSLFEDNSYHIKRFINKEYSMKLVNMLQSGTKYDFVLLESLYMIPYLHIIKKNTNAKILLRSHNVEFEIWDRLANNKRNPIIKWYLKRLAGQLKDFEVRSLGDISYLLPISQKDGEKYAGFGYRGNLFHLPVGMDLNQYPMKKMEQSDKVELGFIGSLDWMPNIEGLMWFLREVWPAVENKYGEKCVLHIAGRNMPRNLLSIHKKSVVIHGEVDDAIAFINQFPYFIVPLFSGSGMRVKILEAMALGKIVLSTKVGIEGIPATADKEYLLTDSKEQYLSAIDNLMENKYSTSIIGRNARSFLEDNYSLTGVSEKFFEYLEMVNMGKKPLEKKVR
ncbi:glycosyltransferase family 4 protein [Membranihabitans maritimus]|uniref:glycosyltransferase family 4 protein n=1 Tax=Membranihabitans maritimus TaxID=2904244 RepID=UPI001F3068A6|nr:glycosyltransferase family 4 protein [Membranihabitans maritimus]